MMKKVAFILAVALGVSGAAWADSFPAAFFVCVLAYWVLHLEQKVRKYESRRIGIDLRAASAIVVFTGE